jgi:hypothetical protein
MGYYISQSDSSFIMKQEHFDAALTAMKEAAKKQKWDWVFKGQIENSKTIVEALTHCRWKPLLWTNEDAASETQQISTTELLWSERHKIKVGDITGLSYQGEKLGAEECFFKAIAPYVEDGSYIEISGEEDYLWRYVFNNGHMDEISAGRDWDDCTGIVKAILNQKSLLPLLSGLHPNLDIMISRKFKGGN